MTQNHGIPLSALVNALAKVSGAPFPQSASKASRREDPSDDFEAAETREAMTGMHRAMEDARQRDAQLADHYAQEQRRHGAWMDYMRAETAVHPSVASDVGMTEEEARAALKIGPDGVLTSDRTAAAYGTRMRVLRGEMMDARGTVTAAPEHFEEFGRIETALATLKPACEAVRTFNIQSTMTPPSPGVTQ